MSLLSKLSGLARDFAVFYRLCELSLRLLGVQAEAATGAQPRDAAVSITCAAAVLFLVLGYLNEVPPSPGHVLSCETTERLAHAKGARQQGTEKEEVQGLPAVVSQCSPWV